MTHIAELKKTSYKAADRGRLSLAATAITLLSVVTAGCDPSIDKLEQHCLKTVGETLLSSRMGEAFKPCLAAAEKGSAAAQAWVGDLYHSGHGTQRSYELAARWWLAAAKQGDGGSQLLLAGLYRDGAGVLKDPIAAYMWYSIAATSGGLFDAAKSDREQMEKSLTPDQLATAQKMAKQCLNSNFRNCD